MVRLVFRPYTQVRRSICTLESLRTSTRVSPGFALLRHSSLTNALLQRNGDIDIIYHTGIRLLLPGLSDMRYLSIYLHRIGNPIFFWRYYERNLRSEDATKNNVLAKEKERYYYGWSVDIKSFEYTGFKQQWIMTIYCIYIVLYNKGIQIINISLCRVVVISIQSFACAMSFFGKWILHNKAY